MRAKSFFYVSLGILALALAYHLGAATATAQAPGNPVVAMTPWVAITANGDLYAPLGNPVPGPFPWVRAGNVLAGSPTPAAQPTFGQLKAQYRK